MTPVQVAFQWGRSAMTAIVQRMLENADDTLFGMAESSRLDEDRRALFDTMRLLRKSSLPLVSTFEEALKGGKVDSVAMSYDTLELVDDKAVEEDIMASRVVARIEDAAKQSLWEYAIRLENFPATDPLRDGFEHLRPQGICKAFRDSVGSMDLDPSTKLILFKLYERQLMSDCSTVYDGINQRLEAAGISSKKLTRRDPVSKLPPGEPERRHPPAFVASWMNAIAPSYQVPAGVSSLLSAAFPGAPGFGASMGASGGAGYGSGTGYGGGPGYGGGGNYGGGTGGGYGAGAGYAGGAGGMGGVPAMGGGGGDAGGGGHGAPGAVADGTGSMQRLSLVGQLMVELTRGWDPNESQAAQDLLVPMIRIALSDPAFFTDAQHPARSVLASLGTSRTGLDVRLAEARAKLDGLASGVTAPTQVAPLSGAELRQFLLSQRSEIASTSARIEGGRAAAYQQIRAVGSGRDLPVGVSSFLQQIWLPMISALHLRFGPESEEMKRASQILQRLFGECRWLPEMKDSAIITAIIEELEKGLRDIAVPNPLITKARTTLQDGLGNQEANQKLLDLETLTERAPVVEGEEAKTETPLEPALADDAAWRAALPVGSWFRVFDRSNDQTQWLSAGVLYPQSRHLSFNGFDGSARLTIERVLFLEDLIAGKAEAVEPTELQQSSIRLLCLQFSGMQ